MPAAVDLESHRPKSAEALAYPQHRRPEDESFCVLQTRAVRAGFTSFLPISPSSVRLEPGLVARRVGRRHRGS